MDKEGKTRGSKKAGYTLQKGREAGSRIVPSDRPGFIGNLRDAGLIKEENPQGNRNEMTCRITDAGEIVFGFYSGPATSSLVKSMLESS